ncbi:MAG: hypothetical protein H0V38_07905 [Sporichthyaceae bacterium]|nr:hypothetical protein [Sporichthyaceae bacterium]
MTGAAGDRWTTGLVCYFEVGSPWWGEVDVTLAGAGRWVTAGNACLASIREWRLGA